MRLHIVTVHGLQRLRYARMQPHPPRQRQLVHQCLLQKRMGELVTAYRVRHLLYHTGRQRLLQYVQQHVLGQVLHQRLQLTELELPTNYRRHRQRVVAPFRHPVETPAYDLPNSLGYPNGPRLGLTSGSSLCLAELSFLHQQTHHLGNEEGIALGLGVNCIHQRVFGLYARCHLYEPSHVLLAQSPQQHTLECPLPGQLPQGFRQRVLP